MVSRSLRATGGELLIFRVFSLSKPDQESRRADSNRFPAHYELACGSPEASYHVLVRGLPKVNTRPRWRLPSYCVPARTNPVAERVTVHTQRTRSGWDLRVAYEFAVGLLRLSRAEPYSQGDPRDPAHSGPVVPDSFRPVRPRERRLRSTSIPPQHPGRIPAPVAAARCRGCPEYGPRSPTLGKFCFATRDSSVSG